LKSLILGYGLTGKSVERYLVRSNVDYLIYDDSPEIAKNIDEDKLYKSQDINSIDQVIISPGISPNNQLVLAFEDKETPIRTDIDIFATEYKGDIIGVTGTNGKTTFVSVLSDFLNSSGVKTITAGNIGMSPLDIPEDKYDFVILELSSYQLHYTTSLNLDIAVIINIYPDHVDWHNSFQNYASAKLKILKFLDIKKSERKVIGSSEDIIKTNLPLTTESTKLNKTKIHPELILALGETTKIIDNKNLYNKFINYIKNTEIKYPHRMETFLHLENKNITFINDSKATNFHAVNQATKLISEEKVDGILILHGITKETPESELIVDSSFKKIIIPKSMNIKLSTTNAEVIYIDTIHHLKETIRGLINSNQIFLFSCGGSSFNDFTNYEERGDFFKELVTSMDIKDD
tara:strand:+ start:5389 stop:6603 length:1215 start_codon:yes stop_codon:yes gene_type:complete